MFDKKTTDKYSFISKVKFVSDLIDFISEDFMNLIDSILLVDDDPCVIVDDAAIQIRRPCKVLPSGVEGF